MIPDPDNCPVTWAVEGLELVANARWVFAQEPDVVQLKVCGKVTGAPEEGLLSATEQVLPPAVVKL
jgi:hypothetical protein